MNLRDEVEAAVFAYFGDDNYSLVEDILDAVERCRAYEEKQIAADRRWNEGRY